MAHREALEAVLAREAGFDGFERVAGLGAVGAAGLRHVGTSAAALAAERLGARLDEIDGAPCLDEIVGHADREARLAVLGDADDRDDAGADLLLAVVDQAAQIFRIEALNRARQELDVADAANGVAVRRPRLRAAAERQLTLRIRQLLLERLAFLDEMLDALDQIFRPRLRRALAASFTR